MPVQKMTARQLKLVLWGCFCLLFSSNSLVMGKTSSLSFNLILETKYTILHYRSLEDLEDFDDEINYSEEGLFSSLFSSSDDDLQKKVKNKVDALFRRVQEILDMRKIMKKVIIKIHHNREEIERTHAEVYGTYHRSSTKRVPRAWFRYKNNTIYVNIDDLHEGMLAHEMAHSIIDHYLIIRPPSATAEILARYVDTHLFD